MLCTAMVGILTSESIAGCNTILTVVALVLCCTGKRMLKGFTGKLLVTVDFLKYQNKSLYVIKLQNSRHTLGWIGKQHHSIKAMNATTVPVSKMKSSMVWNFKVLLLLCKKYLGWSRRRNSPARRLTRRDWPSTQNHPVGSFSYTFVSSARAFAWVNQQNWVTDCFCYH